MMTTGINAIHSSGVIGTDQTQMAPPTAWAANVAPRLLKNRRCGKNLAMIGMVQNREKYQTCLPTGCKTNKAIAIKGIMVDKFFRLVPK